MSNWTRARVRSFQEQQKGRGKARKTTLAALLFLAVYILISNYVFTMRSLENSSMTPGLLSGDRFVFLSFGINHLFGSRGDAYNLPLRRGSIVSISTDDDASPARRAANAIVRFGTAGRVGLSGGRDYIKRVIALPGDEVSIVSHVARVKPKDGSYTYTEFESAANREEGIGEPYEVHFPENTPLWDEGVPFSGNMSKITLGPDECFVLSDDRSNTNDSRTWGPVPITRIGGKAILRYWPITRLGKP
jgi:signal peptidase I